MPPPPFKNVSRTENKVNNGAYRALAGRRDTYNMTGYNSLWGFGGAHSLFLAYELCGRLPRDALQAGTILRRHKQCICSGRHTACSRLCSLSGCRRSCEAPFFASVPCDGGWPENINIPHACYCPLCYLHTWTAAVGSVRCKDRKRRVFICTTHLTAVHTKVSYTRFGACSGWTTTRRIRPGHTTGGGKKPCCGFSNELHFFPRSEDGSPHYYVDILLHM